MTIPTVAALEASLAFLRDLRHEGLTPPQAQSRLHELRSQSPDLAFELVWDEEAFDHSIHYDILLSAPDGSTV